LMSIGAEAHVYGEYRGAVSKSEFDEAWSGALKAFAKSGNWGGVETGVRHVKTYGTGWGGRIDRGRRSGGICPLSQGARHEPSTPYILAFGRGCCRTPGRLARRKRANVSGAADHNDRAVSVAVCRLARRMLAGPVGRTGHLSRNG